MAQKIKKNEEMTDVFKAVQKKAAQLTNGKKFSLDNRKRTMIATGAVLLGGTAFTAISIENGKAVQPPVIPAAIATDSVATQPTITDSTSTTTQVQGGTIAAHHSVPMAHFVSDGMDFQEAYQTARAEVGAGGFFVHEGNLYNTYTVEEWNSLSIQERVEFLDAIDFKPTPVPAPAPTEIATPTDSTIATTVNTDSVATIEPQPVVIDSAATPEIQADTIGFGEIAPAELAIDTAAVSPIDTAATMTEDVELIPLTEPTPEIANEIILEEDELTEEEIEPTYVETEIYGIPAIGIDDDGDGLANAIIFRNPDTGVVYSLIDNDNDGALETVAVYDMETGDVDRTVELEATYEIEMDTLADIAGDNDLDIAIVDAAETTNSNEEVSDDDDDLANVKEDEMPMDDDDDYNNNANVTDMD